mmetsp:Transcript_105373/g.298270  ORF Transcript_105373/g.298270 Transcript_105373/m.298270 type:complete len:238 (+) Transcript_105373:170-883(+)
MRRGRARRRHQQRHRGRPPRRDGPPRRRLHRHRHQRDGPNVPGVRVPGGDHMADGRRRRPLRRPRPEPRLRGPRHLREPGPPGQIGAGRTRCPTGGRIQGLRVHRQNDGRGRPLRPGPGGRHQGCLGRSLHSGRGLRRPRRRRRTKRAWRLLHARLPLDRQLCLGQRLTVLDGHHFRRGRLPQILDTLAPGQAPLPPAKVRQRHRQLGRDARLRGPGRGLRPAEGHLGAQRAALRHA